jgi:signal transduction histidine kinase
VRWTVRDANGVLIDRAKNVASAEFLADLPSLDHAKPRRIARVEVGGRHWRVLQTRLDSTRPVDETLDTIYHDRLILTAAIRLDPAEATLRNLARLSAGLSLAVWFVSAAVGRRLCRRALRPLSTMAEAARVMTVTEMAQRLPAPGTSDELQELSEAFNGLLDRLGEAFARQARFTGDASHQLRTPLAVMLGQIDVALRRDRPADEYRQTLSLVRDQAARLSQIVEMLLFLARADAEAGLPGRPIVELGAWARDHVERWIGCPREADLSLVFQGEGPWLARVHPPLLGQLLDNLLDNAWKYTQPGTPVRIVVGRAGDRVTIAVQDDGPGIDSADVPHVFEPFYRSSHARRQGRPGVGLGLAVSQRIAGAFEGRLTVQSVLGRGSAFQLSLPEVTPLAPSEEPPVDSAPREPADPTLAVS